MAIHWLSKGFKRTPGAVSLCEICKVASDPELQLLCDSCDKGFHTFCLKPKLKEVPDGDWLCPRCRPQEPVAEAPKSKRLTPEERAAEQQRRMLETAAEKDKAAQKKEKKQKVEKQKQEEEAQLPAWSYEGRLPSWAHEGSLVWAKVGGFPWWPALINAPEDGGVLRQPHSAKGDTIWVYNLGAGNFSEVKPEKGIIEYSAENLKKFGDANKIKAGQRTHFKKALKQAAVYQKEAKAEESAAKPYDDSIQCICDRHYDVGFMLCCDQCDLWLHGECVDISEDKAPETYLCPRCVNGEPPPKPKRTPKKRGRGSATNEDDTVTESEGTPAKKKARVSTSVAKDADATESDG